MTQGQLISIEGIDGSGKSAAIPYIAKCLHNYAGFKPLISREPGGTFFAEKIREIVLNTSQSDGNEHLEPISEFLLMAAARAQHFQQLIAPALDRGQWVLVDRFIDSSIAYQGYGRCHGDNAMLAFIQQTNTFIIHRRVPDLTLWFDISPKDARARLGTQIDRFESENESFFQRVYRGYATLCRLEPQRCIRIDANQPKKQLHLSLKQVLDAHFT